LTAAAIVAAVGWGAVADPPASGPAVGKPLPGFIVTPVSGPSAGKKADLFARTGEQPTVLVFARGVNDPLAGLARKLSAAAAKHKDARLNGIVILCDDGKGEARLAELAQEKLPGLQFAVSHDKAAGPKAYNLAPAADVTVVIAHKRIARAVLAYRAGELDGTQADLVVAEAGKVARGIFAPQVGDPLVAYTPKLAVGEGGVKKCQTC
jgi:hypothetical protein